MNTEQTGFALISYPHIVRFAIYYLLDTLFN